MRRLPAFVLVALVALPGLAAAYDHISDRATFLAAVEGRTLTLPLYGLRLTVLPDGTLSGAAMGSGITGTWSRQGGLFCRQMDWSGTDIPYNCQLVEIDGDRIRFTEDGGAGDDAVMRLR